MSTLLGKSSYQELISDAVDDIADDRTERIAIPTLMIWVLEAERKLCEQFEVRERYTLGLNNGVFEYNIQDRPNITSATNTTPIVITAASHGLSNSDRIFIRDVQGNTNANGYFQVKSVTTDTFAIQKYADISKVVYLSGTVTITTLKEHYFQTGESVTISGVAGMTSLNSTFTITRVDPFTFTLSLTTTQIYTSGGLCLEDTTGNSGGAVGGKFWRDDELPTFFKPNAQDIFQRTYGTYKPMVKIVEIDRLLEQMRFDNEVQKVYSDYDAPLMASEWTVGGQRVFKLYPAPQSDQDAQIYGVIQFNPRNYYEDRYTDLILLPANFDEAIVHYVKYKIYGRLKDKQSETESYALFGSALNELKKTNVRHPVMAVTYR